MQLLALIAIVSSCGVAHAALEQSCDDDFSAPAVLKLPDIAPALRSGDALRDTPWLQLATDHYNRGNLFLAVQHFAMAAHSIGFGGAVWGNLGLALTDYVLQQDAASKEERISLLCEAAIAIELGVKLGADAEASGRDETLGTLADVAGCVAKGITSCIATACGAWLGGDEAQARFTAAQRALEISHGSGGGSSSSSLPPAMRHLQAVDALCAPASVSRVTIAIRPFERRRQAISAATAFSTWAVFRTCGVVALSGALSEAAVARAREATAERLEAAMPTITRYRQERRGHQPSQSQPSPPPPSQQHHLEEETLASRDQSGKDLRYELKLSSGVADVGAFVDGTDTAGGSNGEDTEEGFRGGSIDSELLLAVSKLLLHGNSLAIDTLSAVVSLPGCPFGHWHADVSDPRDGAKALVGADARHAPPPGLVSIVPLVNLSAASNGPTEFLLGSHVEVELVDTGGGGAIGWWEAQQAEGDRHVKALELPLDATIGTVVLFDLRIRHRGGANRSPSPRPILYCGYMHRWFYDVVNFKESHTKEWDELQGGRTRKTLLSRVDARGYTKRLEAELEKLGVDVAALRSQRAAEYTERSLVL